MSVVSAQEGFVPVATVKAHLVATGREHESEVLRSALAALGQGRGGAVVIEGEAGIGKSHLARLLGDAAGNRGLGVVEGRADEFDLDRPLAEVEGDAERANRLLQDAWDIDDALGLVSELRTTGPAACKAALAVGDLDRASLIAARFEEVAASTGLWSYDGAAKRCRGLVDGDPELLLAAVDAYRQARHPLDEGLAAEDAAVMLIQAGRQAEGRRMFDQAQAIFERLGAARHARRAAARVRALGVRHGVRGTRRRATAGDGSLTETERRVVALARQG